MYTILLREGTLLINKPCLHFHGNLSLGYTGYGVFGPETMALTTPAFFVGGGSVSGNLLS